MSEAEKALHDEAAEYAQGEDGNDGFYGFLAGAAWQATQMYTQSQLLEALDGLRKECVELGKRTDLTVDDFLAIDLNKFIK